MLRLQNFSFFSKKKKTQKTEWVVENHGDSYIFDQTT